MKQIYFDNSATSRYKPRKVLNALKYWTSHSSNAGHGDSRDSIRLSQKIWDVRKIISDYYKLDNESNVIFTKNCTEALNIVLHGLDFSDKNHVLCSIFEHNSVLRPLENLRTNGKISINYVYPKKDSIRITADDVKQKIDDKTKLVCVCSTSNVTGDSNEINKIGKLCHEKGVLFLVDDAQGAGHNRIDIRNNYINFVAFSGHKGFFAPQGIGALCINYSGKLSPSYQGGTGTESESLSQPAYLPESLESGTLQSSLILSLGEGIKYVNKNYEKMQNKVSKLSTYLINNLKQIKEVTIFSHDYTNSGVISIALKGINSNTASEYLDKKYHIITRSGLHCAPLVHKYLNTQNGGLIRISLNHKNTIKQIKKLIKSIKKCINECKN